METIQLLVATIFATHVYAKTCSCDSSDDFIIVDELTCFMPIIDGYFPFPAGWGFPELDFANLKARDINGNEYFKFVDDAGQGEPGYVTAEPLTMGGVLILNDGLQILFDTGMGEVDPLLSLSGSPTNLQQHLELLGCTDIDIVITSHMHFDHIGWNVKYNKSDDNVIIPNWGHPTVYFVQNDEYYYWQKLQLDDYQKQDPAYYKSKELLATHIDSLVESGQIALRFGNYFISNNVEVKRCIGHTPGHQCINIYTINHENNNKQLKVMLIGDSIHSPYQVCVPDVCPSFDVDMDQSRITRKALIQQGFETHNVLFAPLHFPGIGQIIKCNTCNSQSGYIWKQLNKQQLKEWTENQINGDDEDKTDL